jgi:hypothetical protein
MGDREQFAAMAMQAFITREHWAAAKTARQAVAFADALLEALDATTLTSGRRRARTKKKPRR